MRSKLIGGVFRKGAIKEGRPAGRPWRRSCFRLGGADVVRSRALLALLDVEADGLATTQAIEVERRVHTTLMEEILLAIIGGDEPKSAVGNDFLYGAFWHCRSPPLEHRIERIGPVRERRMPAARELTRRPGERPYCITTVRRVATAVL